MKKIILILICIHPLVVFSQKLDIVEPGSGTVIKSTSKAGFNATDIDASTGDAALRFYKVGVGQWNTRNEPVNNDYQWFELGGGGERMRIQRGSGNVGINQPVPVYKLDVNHSGATGIRSQSSASFSVMDIDAFSGDAALRFIKAGVNKWNTRNEPVNDDYQWFELGGGGERMRIQRASGNVGINQPVPAYKLDVNHGGATGIRSQSSSSFSVVDIDAFSGDAAIRFANNGVNQWNLRNQPGTNNLQIFELGGGGERLIIQNTTGNLGVSQSLPKARLDISGANSTDNALSTNNGFSATTVLSARDLNATGAGSNKIGLYGSVDGGTSQNFGIFGETNTSVSGNSYNIAIFGKDNANVASSYAGYFIGKVYVGGTLTTTGPKPFTIDHPLDPENKVLHHFAIESPEVLNMYSGNATTDATGKVTVNLPEYFSAINKDFRYQLTVIGSFAQAIIGEEIVGNKFVIETSKPNIKVSWEVKGVRNDAYMKNVNDMYTEEMKPESQRGKYFTPKAFGKNASMGVDYMGENEIDISKAGVVNKATVSEVIEGTSLEQKPIIPTKATVNTIIEGTSLEQKATPVPATKNKVEVKQSTDNK